ncbi:hypothetical protein [Methanothermobacter sp.]|uniref:hypothetical protein n=1 Tax=Methanothermobacter sp. TaxID=1884223 RepID=UPI003C77C1F2
MEEGIFHRTYDLCIGTIIAALSVNAAMLLPGWSATVSAGGDPVWIGYSASPFTEHRPYHVGCAL